METKSISIRAILDRLRRKPMLADIQLDAMVDYTVDFIRIMGLPASFDDKTAIVQIDNYAGKLPDDFYEMNQVRTTGCHPVYFRYTTDTFHNSPNKIDAGLFTYKIQGEAIVTSVKEGYIEISYNALAVDDCGLPMIPDNAKFIRALENYIKVQKYEILFEEGKIDARVMDRVDREYCWAVGSCESEMKLLSLDKVESIANIFKSLLSRENAHQRGYGHVGDKEMILIH